MEKYLKEINHDLNCTVYRSIRYVRKYPLSISVLWKKSKIEWEKNGNVTLWNQHFLSKICFSKKNSLFVDKQ